MLNQIGNPRPSDGETSPVRRAAHNTTRGPTFFVRLGGVLQNSVSKSPGISRV